MAWNRYGGNKYNSKKVEVDGIVFDSKKEARRYYELSLLLKSGAIRNLQRQVEYVLIPAQYEVVDGKNKCIERKCSYVADFVYTDNETGNTVVEDTKGYRNPSSSGYALYVVKRKLMLHMYGIRIREV